jgi:hypothetical protein
MDIIKTNFKRLYEEVKFKGMMRSLFRMSTVVPRFDYVNHWNCATYDLGSDIALEVKNFENCLAFGIQKEDLEKLVRTALKNNEASMSIETNTHDESNILFNQKWEDYSPCSNSTQHYRSKLNITLEINPDYNEYYTIKYNFKRIGDDVL